MRVLSNPCMQPRGDRRRAPRAAMGRPDAPTVACLGAFIGHLVVSGTSAVNTSPGVFARWRGKTDINAALRGD